MSDKRYVIAHKSSQTGDTLHVAGALVLSPDVDVVVIHVGDVGTAEALLNFYRQATDPKYPKEAIGPDSATTNKRVKIVYASDAKAADTLYDAMSWKFSDQAKENVAKISWSAAGGGTLSYEVPGAGSGPAKLEQIKQFKDFEDHYLPANSQFMGPLGQATQAIANKFKNPPNSDNYKALYTQLANKLTARNLTSANIIGGTVKVPTFGEKNVPLPDSTPGTKPIILLWARYTGTNSANGHNPDGDSCVQGQKQLVERLTSLNYDVITIGHGPRNGPSVKAKFDVGEFYMNKPIAADRATQQSFFLALMEKYPGRVYQIGQKTGGMDGAALLGIPTIYLEPQGSYAIVRMKKWSDNVPDSDQSVLPFYRSVIIDKPTPAIVRVLNGSIQKIPSNKQYNKWDTSLDLLPRARARLAAMVFVYPEQMGKPEYVRKPLKKPENLLPEKETIWRETATAKEITTRFNDIVSWVEGLPDADVQDTGPEGLMVQKVNQMDLGRNAAGYSDNDLNKVETEMMKLIGDYNIDLEAVLRRPGAYQTRHDAHLD